MCLTQQEQASQLIKYQQNISCHINDTWIRVRRSKFESQDPSAFLTILITVLYTEIARNMNIKSWPPVCYHKRGFQWCLRLHLSSLLEPRGSQVSPAAHMGPQACPYVPYKLSHMLQVLLSWTIHPSASGSWEWCEGSLTPVTATLSPDQRHYVSMGTHAFVLAPKSTWPCIGMKLVTCNQSWMQEHLFQELCGHMLSLNQWPNCILIRTGFS